MTTSDLKPPDPEGNLSVDDVRKIIEKAKIATVDPIAIGLQMFSSLGERATLSGKTLQESLVASGIAVAGPLTIILGAIHEITKDGELVTVTCTQEVVTIVNGVRVRLKKDVKLHLFEEDGIPGLNNIVGIRHTNLCGVTFTAFS